MNVNVEVVEHDGGVSVYYDNVWQKTLGCEEEHIRYVFETYVKYYKKLARKERAREPTTLLMLAGYVEWESVEPGEITTPEGGE